METHASRLPLLATVTLTTVAVVWLSAGTRPDAFFSGDSGLKLMAALSAIAHPARPLEIDLPQIGGRPVPDVEHMIAVHGDHGHVLQSPLFPVLSAPLIDALGLRGAYVLPVLSFIVLVPLLDVIRRRAAPEASFVLLAWIAVCGNPVLFYALEYWEHAPAIALLAASLAAALAARDSPSSLSWTIASGALGGCSILLRPEAAWCLAGMLLIVERRHWLTFAAAAVASLLPFGLVNLLHSGTMLGPHASQSMAPLQREWLSARWSRIHAWFWPDSFAAAVGLGLVASAWLPRIIGRDVRIRQLLALSGAAIVSFAAAERWMSRDSLWQAFPIVLLAAVPAPLTPIVRRLYAIAFITSAAITMTATHDGGAQWGPRFLLISSPLLIVLAAGAATSGTGAGPARVLRVVLIVFVLAAGLLTERSSYLELRSAKRIYGQIVSATSTLTRDGDVIVTNVWWFDQVNASLFGRRVFLFVSTPARATQAMRELATAGVRRAHLVWTDEEEGEPLTPAMTGTCFTVGEVQAIPERRLHLASVSCETP